MVDATAPIALVVEDDIIIRLDAVGILEDAGFRTVDAGSADEAIPLLITHEGEITLVFTDVEMPGSMNGFALARHIAATWPDIGVLVASGRIEPDPGALPETAVFVRKPFSAAVVHDRVRELLPEDQRPEPLKVK
jgi:CheY-like chemotaxis protein